MTPAPAPAPDPYVGTSLDKDALDSLFKTSWPRLKGVLATSGLPDDIIEDAISDTFVELLAEAQKGKAATIETNTFEYLVTRIRRRAGKILRKTKSEGGSIHSGIVDPTQRRPASVLLGAECLDYVRQAESEFAELERQVFELHLSEGLSFREAAERLGATEHACREAYARAITKLRERRGSYSSSFIEYSSYTAKLATPKAAIRAIESLPKEARDVLHLHHVAKTPAETAASELALAPNRYAERLGNAERLFEIKYRMTPEELDALLGADSQKE